MQKTILSKLNRTRREGKHYFHNFRCKCGNIIEKRSDTIAKSCGCLTKSGRHYIDTHGYVRVTINSKVLSVHRMIIEAHIGRGLKKEEQVHHKNGNKSDNRLENLVLCENAKEHNRYNRGWWKDKNNKWMKCCCLCKEELRVTDNFYKSKNQYTYICKQCCKKENKKYFKKLNSCSFIESVKALSN